MIGSRFHSFPQLALFTWCLLLSIADNVYAKVEPLLITPDWLYQHLYDDNLIILDTREEAHYKQGHIRGAINIPVERTFASQGDTYRVGSLSHIKNLFSRHGLTREARIVVYDDGHYLDAARFFWVLEVFGHQDVGLLNGGMTLWETSSLPVETTPNMRMPTNYIPIINHHRITSLRSMQIAIDNPAVTIIDARTNKEYNGEESLALRKGHIPGAVNIPWSFNINGQGNDVGVLIEDSQLSAQYQAYKDKHLVTYCNRGKQSALTYFVLRYLGLDVSVYDGAWLEWGNDSTLPIE